MMTGNGGSIDVQMAVKFTPVLHSENTNPSIGFVLYQNDNFFRSRAFKASLGTNRRVLSAKFRNISGLGVEMIFKPTTVPNASLYDFACVSWNYTLDDWSTYGCSKVNHSNDGLQCFCNHTTNFAVLTLFRRDFKYIDSFNWITILGCSISITGLSLTIIFQIMTRCKTVRTLLIVSICTCLLTFTLLFLLAVENPNQLPQKPKLQINNIPPSDIHIQPDRGTCTAVAALLQYFLLGTFTWSTLYTIHVSRTIRNSLTTNPPNVTVSTVVIGWGLPAVIVALNLGIRYRLDNPLDYRQEEFCWLASLDPKGNFDFKLPMFWGMLIPIAFMLIFNTVLLIHFAAATGTSNSLVTRTRYSLKKILSIFSLAVVLSLSWILGYLLLITHDKTTYSILNIFFCILTTTQGLQIFILFTVRTAIGKKKISIALKSFPHVKIPLHHMKYSLRQGKQSEQVESYKQLETDIITLQFPYSSIPT
ncbi:adhesion G-protein coupled receptor G7 [Esox lucius]|nr:adhesion G-protein coupled receptor G7 [Esox lucius]